MIKPEAVDKVLGTGAYARWQKILDAFIDEQTRAYKNEERYKKNLEKIIMIAPPSNRINRESVRRIGLVWISSLAVLLLGAIAFRIGAQIDWHSAWFRTAVLATFTLVNSLRIVAYVPQMLTAAKDTNGASGISYATWALFLASHLTTIIYAIICLGDAVMALLFLGNALACLAVLTITFFKRRQYTAKLAYSLSKP